jgi:hypothetical protein
MTAPGIDNPVAEQQHLAMIDQLAADTESRLAEISDELTRLCLAPDLPADLDSRAQTLHAEQEALDWHLADLRLWLTRNGVEITAPPARPPQREGAFDHFLEQT